ncbi:MAG: RHS repeat-associated core domain-containing protein, partial [Candidatus Sumerlaeaceae bacterium]
KVDDGGSTTTYYYLNEGSTTAPIWDKIHVMAIEKGDGSRTDYERDANYRVTGIKRPLNRNTYFGYDSAGNQVWKKDPMGNTWFYRYDGLGRLTEEEDPTSGTTRHGYNTRGQVTVTTDTEGRATTYTYDGSGRRTAGTSLGVTTTFAFDAFDRLTTTTDQLGNKTVAGYDALNRQVSTTDPMGNKTRQVYHAYSNLLKNVIFADDSITTYSYDANDRLTTYTNERGKNRVYGYDLLGRKVSEKNPLGQTTTFSYGAGTGCSSCSGGASSHLMSKTDPANRTSYFDYETTSGRLWRKRFSGSSDTVSYSYDAAGRKIRTIDTRLPSADLGSQRFAWAYDANDRLTSETYPDGVSVRWSFDALGRRRTLTDPHDNWTTYTYNTSANNKKLSSINHGLLGQTNYTYSSTTGLQTDESYPNQTANLYSYDALSRVSSIESTSDNIGANFHYEAYTYNAKSIRTRIDFRDDSNTIDWYKIYGYDKRLRLTDEYRFSTNNAQLYGNRFTYDAGGNRTQLNAHNISTTSTYTYDYNDADQLTFRYLPTSDADEFYYDSNGNLQTDDEFFTPSRFYTHNRENRLEQFELDGVNQVSYTYDDSGRLLLRTGTDGTKSKYYYDGINQLLTKERPSGGVWRPKKVNLLKQASIGQILAHQEYTAWSGSTPSAWNNRWYHYDLLGNTTALSNQNGIPADQYDMEAFGTVRSGSQAGAHLTTKEWDADAGLYYFSARWLDSRSGQFLEHSPLRHDKEQPYAISQNSPTRYVDPSGKQFSDDDETGGGTEHGTCPECPVPLPPPCPCSPEDMEKCYLDNLQCHERAGNQCGALAIACLLNPNACIAAALMCGTLHYNCESDYDDCIERCSN